MELMQGNLARPPARAADGPASRCRTTLAHCLRALKYLHARGVIHGDIKPRNLMIDHRTPRQDRRLRPRPPRQRRRRQPAQRDRQVHRPGSRLRRFRRRRPAERSLCPRLLRLRTDVRDRHFEDLFPGLNAFGRDKQAAWMMWHAAPDRRLPEIRRVLDGVPPDLAKVIQKTDARRTSPSATNRPTKPCPICRSTSSSSSKGAMSRRRSKRLRLRTTSGGSW